ncbi:hypothetical protein FLAG1_00486 [Fusarium langsethiae]|uniref:Uncharacterized protein n=1 Tax=Fusarium langsethiae TaxID=179993 RepID=A0A0M9F5S8_FUSLA|nr:hypothetical protein FLAG1_00486 [Fusarium langsethiae]GKT98374.1 unnamed protein product [Fusarium langsethiae]GKU13155.1 unnamed protein product [Fusarium langsethiae]
MSSDTPFGTGTLSSHDGERDHIIDLTAEEPTASPMAGSRRSRSPGNRTSRSRQPKDNRNRRLDRSVRQELSAVAPSEANLDAPLTFESFSNYPGVASERQQASQVSNFTDLTIRENEAFVWILAKGIQTVYPDKTPTIRDWHAFNRSVFNGWTSRSDAPGHPVLRRRRLQKTKIAVGKLISDADSPTNDPARRAGASVFLSITLNHEQGTVKSTCEDTKGKRVGQKLVEFDRGLDYTEARAKLINNYDAEERDRIFPHNKAVVVCSARRIIKKWAERGTEPFPYIADEDRPQQNLVPYVTALSTERRNADLWLRAIGLVETWMIFTSIEGKEE